MPLSFFFLSRPSSPPHFPSTVSRETSFNGGPPPTPSVPLAGQAALPMLLPGPAQHPTLQGEERSSCLPFCEGKKKSNSASRHPARWGACHSLEIKRELQAIRQFLMHTMECGFLPYDSQKSFVKLGLFRSALGVKIGVHLLFGMVLSRERTQSEMYHT